MNHQYPQSNPGTYVSSLRCETLDAARVGSTDTAILRFGSIGTPAGTGLAVTDSAANGTIVEIQRPGLYACNRECGQHLLPHTGWDRAREHGHQYHIRRHLQQSQVQDRMHLLLNLLVR